MRAFITALAALPATLVAQVPPPVLSVPAPPPVTQTASPPIAATPQPALVRVVVTTTIGRIVLALEKERAPVTTANFLRYVEGKKLDGVGFYRAVKVAPGYGLVQFGTRNDPKRTLPGIAHEPTTKTKLSHVEGTISMAMARPGTAAGDFFITVGNLPSMDAAAGQPGFAAFGHVVEGMDVVRAIMLKPTSPTQGEGVMKGQMLSPAVAITSVRRLP